MCEFERLVRVLLFDNDQILLYNDESVIANLIRLHLSTIRCKTEAEQRFRASYTWWAAAYRLGCNL